MKNTNKMVNSKKSKLKKRKSASRIEETNLVVKLYTSFILSAAETFGNNNWKISNENKHFGSCYGLALESELGDTFLKFKHRRSLKGDDLLSVNIKNEFSLAKYILFSKTVSNLNIKNMVLCTTATIRENNLLIKNSKEYADLIDKTFEGCEKYIINKSCSQTILKNVIEYQNNISRNHENKNWKKVPVKNEDIVSFCEKFVCIIIKEDLIEENILRKMESLQNKFSHAMTSYEDVIEQIENWCGNALNDEYMTNTHIKAILFKEQNKKLSETKDVILKKTIMFRGERIKLEDIENLDIDDYTRKKKCRRKFYNCINLLHKLS